MRRWSLARGNRRGSWDPLAARWSYRRISEVGRCHLEQAQRLGQYSSVQVACVAGAVSGVQSTVGDKGRSERLLAFVLCAAGSWPSSAMSGSPSALGLAGEFSSCCKVSISAWQVGHSVSSLLGSRKHCRWLQRSSTQESLTLAATRWPRAPVNPACRL